MRIKKITVKKFKNLVDFECVFSDSNISAFIGNNGAGKSNILELITRAFSNAMNFSCGKLLPTILPNDTPSVIDCIIEYELNGIIYQLFYNVGILKATEDNKIEEGKPPIFVTESIAILHDGKLLKRSEYINALPTSILLYYAGETNRQKANADDTYDKSYERKLIDAKSDDLPGLRFMDYYNIEDLPLLLLVLSTYKSTEYKKIMDLFNCKSILPKFNIVLQKPKKAKGEIDTWWNSRGFVKNFLNSLRKYVSATQDMSKKYLMFFDSADELQKIADNEYELFSKLKALKNYGILNHIGIGLEKDKEDIPFSQSALSEGEKQMALIYLLTSFSAKSSSLYLFDEFDAYLHLNWQRSISKMLNDIDVNGHIIFTTHSPGTISQIKSDDLYIMKSGSIIYPESETYNRALDEIMLEQMNVSMRSDEVEKLYDQFKQSIADGNREQAERWVHELETILNKNDPLFLKLRINMRRI
jgi:SMC domain protein